MSPRSFVSRVPRLSWHDITGGEQLNEYMLRSDASPLTDQTGNTKDRTISKISGPTKSSPNLTAFAGEMLSGKWMLICQLLPASTRPLALPTEAFLVSLLLRKVCVGLWLHTKKQPKTPSNLFNKHAYTMDHTRNSAEDPPSRGLRQYIQSSLWG